MENGDTIITADCSSKETATERGFTVAAEFPSLILRRVTWQLYWNVVKTIVGTPAISEGSRQRRFQPTWCVDEKRGTTLTVGAEINSDGDVLEY